MKKKNKAPEESETVTVTMSRETAVAVKLACEEYIRFRMGQFEDFVNEVCCWDYTEQMEKECHTSEERKKFHREHEQDFRKCMRLRNHMREAYRAESVWLAIRYALAWHDFPKGGMGCDFFIPLNRSDQPMPKVEVNAKTKKGEQGR